ncbi:hypothetical protein ACTNBL_07890 [Enterococcus villorum]|uniref:Uncharacterized protein n=2 Tax=Enterococcus villorum TaxID=112904 RepID=A0A511J4E6_9ENTE|nr:hypothetical protein [Enterococcus villorum]EOH88718.1 hypothetical protein UAO_01822 [Enterococcus villorum ATCC 700913]EOW76355.1 hypothetical protein I591_01658 [Enterococcus villorum ATCC 700913]GEL92583.1 hypothetical protein EVI01_19200 [Enterococcus villorum]
MAKEIILIDHIKKIEMEEVRLPIFEALILLENVNTQMIRNKEKGSCRIRIYNHKNLLLHAMELQFPLNDAIEEVISAQYQLTASKKRTLKKNKKKIAFKKLNPSIWFKINNIRFFTNLKQVWFAGVIVFSLFIFTKLTYYHFFEDVDQPGNMEMSDENEWQRLVEEQWYLKAAELYPEKRHELIDYLTEKKEFTWLKEMNEQYPTQDAQFDLSFFNKEWLTVIKIQPENLTDKRQVMLALAYLELNQLEEAQILNKHLESEELTIKLDQSYFKRGISFLKEKKIEEAKKNLALIQEEEKKSVLQIHINHASIMIDFIHLYQKNEDKENQLLWEQRLKKLGDEEKGDEEKKK